MAKRFRFAFAENGNRTTVEDATQASGLLSYQIGYGPQYSLDIQNDPTARRISRDRYNQVLHDITSNVQEWQNQLYPDYVPPSSNGGTAVSYGKGMIVTFGLTTRISLVDNNVTQPDNTSNWDDAFPTPVILGGTGADNAAGARTNLGVEQIAQEQAHTGDSQLLGGYIFPTDSESIFPLGSPPSSIENVPIGVSELRVDTGISPLGEVLSQWTSSGDFKASARIITDISANSLGGYDVITSSGTFEFLSQENKRLRDDFAIEGWAADNSGALPADAAIRAAHVHSLGTQYPGTDTGGGTASRPCQKVKSLSKNGTFKISTGVEWSLFARFDGGGNIFFPDASLPANQGMFWGDGYVSMFENAVFTETIGSPVLYTHKAFDLDSMNKDQGLTKFKRIEFKGLSIGARYDLQSSIVSFEDCKWDNVRKFVQQINCDSCTIEKSWGSEGNLLGMTGSGSFDILGGSLHITGGSLFVPSVKAVDETAWVDMRGTQLVIDGKSRFGGEAGSKTIVNWRTRYSNSAPLSPRSLVIRDAWADTIDGGSGSVSVSPSCMVRLFEVPNHIDISGNRGLVDTRHVIAWGRSGGGSAAARLDLLSRINEDIYTGGLNINTQEKGRVTFNFSIKDNSLQLFPLSSTVEFPEAFNNVFAGKPVRMRDLKVSQKFSSEPNGFSTKPTVTMLTGTSCRVEVPVTFNTDFNVTVTLNTSYSTNTAYRATRQANVAIYRGTAGGVDTIGVKTSMTGDSSVPSGFLGIPAIPDIEAKFRDSVGTITSTITPGTSASLVLDVTGMNNAPAGFEDTVEVFIES